jgi:hypothetical protein
MAKPARFYSFETLDNPSRRPKPAYKRGGRRTKKNRYKRKLGGENKEKQRERKEKKREKKLRLKGKGPT